MKNEGLCKQVSMELLLGEWMSVSVVLQAYLKEKYGVTDATSLKKFADEQVKSNKEDSGFTLGIVVAFLKINQRIPRELASLMVEAAKSDINKCEESKHEQE